MTGAAQKPDSVFSTHYIPELAYKKPVHPEFKKILDKMYHDLRDFYIAKSPETGQALLTDLPTAKAKALESLKSFKVSDVETLNKITQEAYNLYKIAGELNKTDKTFNFEKSLKQYINELESSRTIY